MGNFWNIVGFEFKKIVLKKSIIITILMALALTAVSFVILIFGNFYRNGEVFETQLEAIQKDRAYARSLAGRPINSELLLEASEAYQKIPLTANYYIETEEYELYVRKYSSIGNLMRPVYSSPSIFFEFTDIQNLTKEQADAFYTIRSKKLTDSVNSLQRNQKSKDTLLLLDEGIKKPFIFDYTDGYTKFFSMMYTVGILISFVLAICLSPIFAAEYTGRTDQLILSSKNGKKQLIYAKLFVGLSLSVVLSTIFTALTYVGSMLIYGSDGANASFQLLVPMCLYPLNMGQFAFIFFASTLFANILIASITMLISARLKSSFAVIIFVFLVIIVPLFINASDSNVFLHNLVSLFPTNMMTVWNLSSPLLYEIFGLSIEPYIFMPIFAALLSIVLVPFAFKGFKNHQVV